MTISEYSIYNTIDLIRKRPGMYIGDPSPKQLFVFLTGYGMAMDDAGITDISHPPFFREFHDWVARKLGFHESTAGWPNMIMAVTLGLNPKKIRWENYAVKATYQQKSEATELVFKLIDEYRDSEH